MASVSVTRYGSVAMMFHWVIAALLVANIAGGLYMADLPRSDPWRYEIFQIHKSIGLTVLVLSLARLAWRLLNPPPPLPAGMHPAMKGIAHATHYVFYALIIAIPLAGWLMVSASPLGNPTSYFGLFDWPNLPFFTGQARTQLRATQEMLEDVHATLAWGAIVLVPIHVAAALYHHVLLKDDVLRRMVPGMRTGNPT